MPDDLRTLTRYEQDFYAWATEQARQLRAAGKALDDPARQPDGLPTALRTLDWQNLAEEIEGLARRDRRELASRIATIVEHLAKLQFSPAQEPRTAWIETIGRSRREIRDLLVDNPSLRRQVAGLLRENAADALHLAARLLLERGEAAAASAVRVGPSYTPEQVLEDWWPERVAIGAPAGRSSRRARRTVIRPD